MPWGIPNRTQTVSRTCPSPGTRISGVIKSPRPPAGLPAKADVIAAYLYWSGFRLNTTVFSDTASNFNNWNRNSEDGNQTRVPTGDGDTNGVWNTTPYWDDVDETTAT